MNCYICQDICLVKSKKCNCDGYISYTHDKCLYEMILKTNNKMCYFCDTEFKISNFLLFKLYISNLLKNNYLLKILFRFVIFFYFIFYNVDIHLPKEIYYEALIESEFI